MANENGRKIGRKRITVGDSYVDVPVILEISFVDPSEQWQEYRFIIDNSAQSSRFVHAVEVQNDDGDDSIQVERIDKWPMIDAVENGQETVISLDNVTGEQSSPPHFTTHLKTHVFRYVNPDDSDIWIDSEIIDKIAIVGENGQEKLFALNNPDVQADEATQAEISDTANGIDPPYRLDPFQNIINWNGATATIRFVVAANQSITSPITASWDYWGYGTKAYFGNLWPGPPPAWPADQIVCLTDLPADPSDPHWEDRLIIVNGTGFPSDPGNAYVSGLHGGELTWYPVNYVSSDGFSWKVFQKYFDYWNIALCCYGNGTWIFGGYTYPDGKSMIYWSQNGKTWELVPGYDPATDYILSVQYHADTNIFRLSKASSTIDVDNPIPLNTAGDPEYFGGTLSTVGGGHPDPAYYPAGILELQFAGAEDDGSDWGLWAMLPDDDPHVPTGYSYNPYLDSYFSTTKPDGYTIFKLLSIPQHWLDSQYGDEEQVLIFGQIPPPQVTA